MQAKRHVLSNILVQNKEQQENIKYFKSMEIFYK